MKVLSNPGLFALILAAPLAQAQSPNALRGQRLYENACIACHGESVHDRKQRSANSFETVRNYVKRWSGVVATQWSAEDIEDVTLYLNERYYKFICPTESCRPERAEQRRNDEPV